MVRVAADLLRHSITGKWRLSVAHLLPLLLLHTPKLLWTKHGNVIEILYLLDKSVAYIGEYS